MEKRRGMVRFPPSMLQAILDFFGAKPLARIFAGGVVGALLTALSLLKDGGPGVGSWTAWLIGGASMGLLAGLLLTWPRAFPGAVICLVGLFVVCVPMSYADGSPVPLGHYLIKTGVGLGIAAIGMVLLLWARKRRNYSPIETVVSDMRSRYYVRRIAGLVCLPLALLTLGAGLWLVYDELRRGQGVAAGVIMVAFGVFLLYGAIRWIRDQGYGLERVPPDLEVPGLPEFVSRARETLPTFLELVRRDVGQAYVKFPVYVEDGVTEHLWGQVHSLNGDAFAVSLANAPFQKEIIGSGERKVATSEIEDWMVVDERGQVRGAYSLIAVVQCFERDGKWLSPRMRRQRALLIDAPVR